MKDLAASREFYETLGFEVTGGDAETWSILVSGATVIGLFQGMFDGNILTFNPGWNGPGEEAATFTDVRDLKQRLEAEGLEIVDDHTEVAASGPAHFRLVDPDGNDILIDQHR